MENIRKIDPLIQTKERLEKCYNYITKTILPYQSAELGLFRHLDYKEYGQARENVYCALSLWATSLAFKYFDDSSGKSYELEHTAIKCMRGLLYCWMQQANKLERFKRDFDPNYSLGTLFNIYDGTVYSGKYNHLQIDAYALYILVLCQMTVSGCCIIFSKDEASFIQNLIFSIERTYRTSDYGCWGTGSRYENKPELNSSSIAMAKAALEAANGLNIMGTKADPACVLFSDPDAHYRNTSVLKNLLPRESFSKSIDASLLILTGFPAFAIDFEKKKTHIINTIDEELKGNYGYKRYHLDEVGIPLSESSDKCNITMYNGYESEWPIFYVYQAINASFSNDKENFSKCDEIIKKVIIHNSEGLKTMPMYYHVKEYAVANMQPERLAYPGNDQIFLWGQSLYIIYKLIKYNLIKISVLDPLQRHILRKESFKPVSANKRYAAYQSNRKNPIVQICLLSADRRTQTNLSTYGVMTQNLKEIEPAFVCSPAEIISIFSLLGKNNRLGLSGRPTRPIGLIHSCKIFHFLGKILITYPLSLDDQNFYLSHDVQMMILHIKRKLIQISRLWNMSGRPTIILLLKPEHFVVNRFNEMMKFIYSIKSNMIKGVTIKIDRFQNLIGTACNEYLDFLPETYNISVHHCYDESKHVLSKILKSDSKSFSKSLSPSQLTRQNAIDTSRDISACLKKISYYDDKTCLSALREEFDYRLRLHILKKLYIKHGPQYMIDLQDSTSNVINEIAICFESAKEVDDWSNIRFSAGMLGKTIDALSPSIALILVHEKLLIMGTAGKRQFFVTYPLTPDEIYKRLCEYTLEDDPRDTCLQQEVILNVAHLIISNPDIFKDIHKINIGWIVVAMQSLLTWSSHSNDTVDTSSIYNLCPIEIDNLLYITLMRKEAKFLNMTLKCLNHHQRRFLESALCVVPKDFYLIMWKILTKSLMGIKIDKEHIAQLPTLHVMTADEINFKFLVEMVISSVEDPVRRGLMMEMIGVIAIMIERNPEIIFHQCLDIGSLINDAKNLYNKSKQGMDGTSLDSDISRQAKIITTVDSFEFLPPTLNDGTLFYMFQVVVNQLVSERSIRDDPNATCFIS